MAKQNKHSKAHKAVQQPKAETVEKKPSKITSQTSRIIIYLVLIMVVMLMRFAG